MSDTLPNLKRRLSAYEAELLMLERSYGEIKEAVLRVRMEIERRTKEAAYARPPE